MGLIDADAYFDSIRPRGISEEMWKESEAYKSIMRMPTVYAVPMEPDDNGNWDVIPMATLEFEEDDDDE